MKTTKATNAWGAVPAGGEDKTFLHWGRDGLAIDAINAIVNGTGQFRVEGTLDWIDVFHKRQTAMLHLWWEGEGRIDGRTRKGRLEAHQGGPEGDSNFRKPIS